MKPWTWPKVLSADWQVYDKCLWWADPIEMAIRSGPQLKLSMDSSLFYHFYCKTLFFRCILISRFSSVKKFAAFQFGGFTVSKFLHITKNMAYRTTELLTFYADKLMVMGNSKNLRVFNFAILFKSQKFDAREINVFYSMHVLVVYVWKCNIIETRWQHWTLTVWQCQGTWQAEITRLTYT